MIGKSMAANAASVRLRKWLSRKKRSTLLLTLAMCSFVILAYATLGSRRCNFDDQSQKIRLLLKTDAELQKALLEASTSKEPLLTYTELLSSQIQVELENAKANFCKGRLAVPLESPNLKAGATVDHSTKLVEECLEMLTGIETKLQSKARDTIEKQNDKMQEHRELYLSKLAKLHRTLGNLLS